MFYNRIRFDSLHWTMNQATAFHPFRARYVRLVSYLGLRSYTPGYHIEGFQPWNLMRLKDQPGVDRTAAGNWSLGDR
jgi:hypothetical protein